MTQNQRYHDISYKVQAAKYAKGTGINKVVRKLGIDSPLSAKAFLKKLFDFVSKTGIFQRETRARKKQMNFFKKQAFFRSEPSSVHNRKRLMFIAIKTNDGKLKNLLVF